MKLLTILRQIQRPTTQGHSSHAKYENSQKIIFISFQFLTIPMIIHIDRVLLTSAESKYFLFTYQLITHYLLM